MTTNDITALIAEIADLKRQAEADLTDVDSMLRPGRILMQNQAKQAYSQAFGVLRSMLGHHSGAIVVTGKGAGKFAPLAAEEGPAVVLDASEAYSKLAEGWYQTVRIDKKFALDSLPAFLKTLGDVAFPLGIRSIMPPDFGKRFGTDIPDFATAVAFTREVMRETVGDEFNILYLGDALARKVVAEEWDLKFVPVVILNATEGEAPLFDVLFNGTVVEVEVDEECDTDDVVAAFHDLKAKKTGAAAPKRRGRPPGSKNKPKTPATPETKSSPCTVYEGEGETCTSCNKPPSDHLNQQ